MGGSESVVSVGARSAVLRCVWLAASLAAACDAGGGGAGAGGGGAADAAGAGGVVPVDAGAGGGGAVTVTRDAAADAESPPDAAPDAVRTPDAAPDAESPPDAAPDATPDAAPATCTEGERRACALPGCPDDAGRAGVETCAGGAFGACTAEDTCNALDDDCDGDTDEDAAGVGAPCSAGAGLCAAAGVTACTPEGGLGCTAEPGVPVPELCGDALDQNCDGVADDGCAACLIDADCPADFACEGEACVPAAPGCLNDADCPADRVCLGAECVPDAAGCAADADCDAGLICLDAVCAEPPPRCAADADCAAGERCEGGACVVVPPMCLDDADCLPGEACTLGACALVPGGCRTDADCAAADRCVAGFCAPRPLDCLPDAAEEDDAPEAAAPLGVAERAPADFCDDAEDWRALTVEAGQAYSFATDLLAPGTDTRLEVFDGDGRTRRALNDDALPGVRESRIDGWSAEAGGTIYLRVTAADGAFGPDRGYTLSAQATCADDAAEEDDTLPVARDVPVGAPPAARRHCDPDFASFVAVAGRAYVVETRGLTGGADTVLEVFGIDGRTRIAASDDYRGTLASHVEFVAPAGGRYAVRVGSFNELYGGERGYLLSVREAAASACATAADCAPGERCAGGACVPDATPCEPDADEDDDTPATARRAAVDQALPGRNFCDDAADWLVFDAEAGAGYDLETDDLARGTDTVIEVYAADGQTRLATRDEGSDTPGASRLLDFRAPEAGPVFVRVRSAGGATGSGHAYAFVVRRHCDDDAFEDDDTAERASAVAAPLQGEAHRHCRDADWVRLPVQAHTAHVFSTSGLVGGADTQLALYDADGRRLGADDDGGGGLASRLAYNAESDGELFLRVGSFGERYGGARAYRLSIEPAQACTQDAECPAALVCLAGVCDLAPTPCVIDADCAGGESCAAGLCAPGERCLPDAFEEDDTPDAARRVDIGGVTALNHCDDATDHLRFRARAGQTLDVETGGLGPDADTALAVLSPDGAQVLAENDDAPDHAPASRIRGWVVPADGDYLLRAESHAALSGAGRDYQLSLHETCLDDAFEPDDTPAAAREIVVGTTQRRAHCADEDWVRFEGLARKDYRIETLGLQGGEDTLLELYDAGTGALLAADDDGAGNRASRVVYATGAAPQTLLVRVRTHGDRYGGLRAYSLTVIENLGRCAVDDDCLPSQACRGGVCVLAPPRCFADAFEENDAADTAHPMALGEPAPLNFCDDAADWLSFDAVAGQRYDVQTSALDPVGGTNTTLELLGPDGATVLRRDDDGAGDGGASLIAGFTAPTTERYFVRVTNAGDRAGANRDYTVIVRDACTDDPDENDDTAETATPISPAEPPRALKLCQDADWLQFPVLAGRGYRVETSALAGGADTMLAVYGPDGGLIGRDDDAAGDAASRLDFVAGAPGNATVQIESADGLYGGARAYALDVSEIAVEGICAADDTCALGEACVGGRCILPPGHCRDQADCVLPERCVAHACQIVLTCSPDEFEDDEPPGFPNFMFAGQIHTRNFCDDALDLASVGLRAGRTYDLFTDHLEGDTDTHLTVLDFQNAVIAQDDDGGGARRAEIRNLPTPEFGGFRVQIRSVGGVSGDAHGYRFGVVEHCDEDPFEPDDDAESAHAVVVDGEAETHVFCRSDDWITFDAHAGVDYAIAGGARGDANPALELFDAGGRSLGSNDNGPDGVSALLRWRADHTGPVRVRFYPIDGNYGGDRVYTVRVYTGCETDLDCPGGQTCVARACVEPLCRLDAFEPDDDAGAARLVEVGKNVEHTFCDDATDWFAADLFAGQAYDAETYNLSLGTDTVIEVYTPDGAQMIASDDDGAMWGTASRLSNLSPPADGRYLFLVRTYSRNFLAGWQYTVNVRTHCDDDRFEHDDNHGDAHPVEVGAPPEAHRLCASPDWIRFGAVAGTTYRISTTDLIADTDTVITLFDTDGQSALLQNDDAPGLGLGSRIEGFTAPQTATYFVQIRGYDDFTGADKGYSISVETQP